MVELTVLGKISTPTFELKLVRVIFAPRGPMYSCSHLSCVLPEGGEGGGQEGETLGGVVGLREGEPLQVWTCRGQQLQAVQVGAGTARRAQLEARYRGCATHPLVHLRHKAHYSVKKIKQLILGLPIGYYCH